jgi:serine/threonine protein kinase
MLERFLREGKVAASLDHPHIIHIDSNGVQEETFTSSDATGINECRVPYIVMEYAKGGDLRKRLKPGQTLSLAEILHIFDQLCAAVQYVHDRGMIHRDIKPANILFREPPQEGGEVEVILSDFDLTVDDYDTLSQPNAGTIAYMPPEQLLGAPQKESDIFSLGVILYQLCTGRRPSPLQPLEKPSLLNSSLPRALDDVILRALSKESSQRFASASLFWQAIQSAVRETSLQSQIDSVDTHFLDSVQPAIPSALGPRKPGRDGPMSARNILPSKRKKRAAIIIALVIVVLLLSGSWAVSVNASVLTNVIHKNALPSARIIITPTSKTVQDTSLIQGVSGTSDPDNYQVTVRPLNSTKTDTKRVATTGYFHQDAQLASGNITFFNNSLTAFNVPAGTTFQVGNVQIVTDGKAVVPAATLVSLVQPGQTTVPAHAVQGGVAGNIAALAINQSCCGSTNITAQNQNAFTGGKDAVDYKFLQQNDVDGFINTDKKILTQNTYNNIKILMKSNEQLLGEIHCDDAQVTEDAPLGDQGPTKAVTTAYITMSVTCSAEVFDANAVQRIAQSALKQKALMELGVAYVLANNIVTQVRPETQQNNVSFQVTAQGVWCYRWTDTLKQALLNAIRGKSITQAQDIVNRYQGVGNAKIVISNGKSILPGDVNQIALDVKVLEFPAL